MNVSKLTFIFRLCPYNEDFDNIVWNNESEKQTCNYFLYAFSSNV